MFSARGTWVQHAIVVYCLWNARTLVDFYKYTPFDPWAWVALVVWVVPCIWCLARGSVQNTWIEGLLLGGSLLLSVLGSIVQMNAIKYLGITCALATYSPWMGWSTLLWMAAASSWMPALGYFFGQKVPITLLRIAIASLFLPLFMKIRANEKEATWVE